MVTKLINFISVLSIVLGNTNAFSHESKPVPEVHKTHYNHIAEQYSQYGIKNTVYLAYRDVPMLMSEFLNVDLSDKYNALDFGCGTGISTRLLKRISQNAHIEGVDISSDMLRFAVQKDKSGRYTKVKSNKLPNPSSSLDFVFSSFAFLDMQSKKDIKVVLSEIRRVLKPDGVFILVTASEEMFNPKFKWLSLDNQFDQNKTVASGQIAKVKVKNTNITFYDYYWTEKDYEDLFKANGLRLVLKHKPLGNKSDKITWAWKSENARLNA